MEPCSHGGRTCLLGYCLLSSNYNYVDVIYKKNNYLSSGIRYANALTAVIIFIVIKLHGATGDKSPDLVFVSEGTNFGQEFRQSSTCNNNLLLSVKPTFIA